MPGSRAVPGTSVTKTGTSSSCVVAVPISSNRGHRAVVGVVVTVLARVEAGDVRDSPACRLRRPTPQTLTGVALHPGDVPRSNELGGASSSAEVLSVQGELELTLECRGHRRGDSRDRPELTRDVLGHPSAQAMRPLHEGEPSTDEVLLELHSLGRRCPVCQALLSVSCELLRLSFGFRAASRLSARSAALIAVSAALRPALMAYLPPPALPLSRETGPANGSPFSGCPIDAGLVLEWVAGVG